jgi:hypothetical protein
MNFKRQFSEQQKEVSRKIRGGLFSRDDIHIENVSEIISIREELEQGTSRRRRREKSSKRLEIRTGIRA